MLLQGLNDDRVKDEGNPSKLQHIGALHFKRQGAFKTWVHDLKQFL